MAYLMPLESGDENLGYCTYTQVLVPKTDNNLMAMNISQETAMNIIGTCIKLREDKPFREIMQEVTFMFEPKIRNTQTDLLMKAIPVPTTATWNTTSSLAWGNVGEMENKGW